MKVSYVVGNYEIDQDTVVELLRLGFRKIQLVYVPLSDKDRSIVAQGVVTNTLAKVGSRKSNSPFAYPDYFTRGNNELNTNPVGDIPGRITDTGAFSIE